MTAKTARAHGKVHTWPPLPVPPRDPKVDPIFGDVYRLTGDKLFVLFLHRQADGEWLGIPLNGLDNVLELYVAFDRGVWEFVEHIDGSRRLVAGIDFAAGADRTYVTTLAGRRKLSRLSDAEYEETFGRARP